MSDLIHFHSVPLGKGQLRVPRVGVKNRRFGRWVQPYARQPRGVRGSFDETKKSLEAEAKALDEDRPAEAPAPQPEVNEPQPEVNEPEATPPAPAAPAEVDLGGDSPAPKPEKPQPDDHERHVEAAAAKLPETHGGVLEGRERMKERMRHMPEVAHWVNKHPPEEHATHHEAVHKLVREAADYPYLREHFHKPTFTPAHADEVVAKHQSRRLYPLDIPPDDPAQEVNRAQHAYELGYDESFSLAYHADLDRTIPNPTGGAPVEVEPLIRDADGNVDLDRLDREIDRLEAIRDAWAADTRYETDDGFTTAFNRLEAQIRNLYFTRSHLRAVHDLTPDERRYYDRGAFDAYHFRPRGYSVRGDVQEEGGQTAEMYDAYGDMDEATTKVLAGLQDTPEVPLARLGSLIASSSEVFGDIYEKWMDELRNIPHPTRHDLNRLEDRHLRQLFPRGDAANTDEYRRSVIAAMANYLREQWDYATEHGGVDEARTGGPPPGYADLLGLSYDRRGDVGAVREAVAAYEALGGSVVDPDPADSSKNSPYGAYFSYGVNRNGEPQSAPYLQALYALAVATQPSHRRLRQHGLHDAPPGVQADWLEENGYPKEADYVRRSHGLKSLRQKGTKALGDLDEPKKPPRPKPPKNPSMVEPLDPTDVPPPDVVKQRNEPPKPPQAAQPPQTAKQPQEPARPPKPARPPRPPKVPKKEPGAPKTQAGAPVEERPLPVHPAARPEGLQLPPPADVPETPEVESAGGADAESAYSRDEFMGGAPSPVDHAEQDTAEAPRAPDIPPRFGHGYVSPPEEQRAVLREARAVDRLIDEAGDSDVFNYDDFDDGPQGLRSVVHSDPADNRWGHLVQVVTDGERYGVELLDCKNNLIGGTFGHDRGSAEEAYRDTASLLQQEGPLQGASPEEEPPAPPEPAAPPPPVEQPPAGPAPEQPPALTDLGVYQFANEPGEHNASWDYGSHHYRVQRPADAKPLNPGDPDYLETLTGPVVDRYISEALDQGTGTVAPEDAAHVVSVAHGTGPQVAKSVLAHYGLGGYAPAVWLRAERAVLHHANDLKQIEDLAARGAGPAEVEAALRDYYDKVVDTAAAEGRQYQHITQQLRAAKLDAAPAEIQADWLEENGHPGDADYVRQGRGITVRRDVPPETLQAPARPRTPTRPAPPTKDYTGAHGDAHWLRGVQVGRPAENPNDILQSADAWLGRTGGDVDRALAEVGRLARDYRKSKPAVAAHAEEVLNALHTYKFTGPGVRVTRAQRGALDFLGRLRRLSAQEKADRGLTHPDDRRRDLVAADHTAAPPYDLAAESNLSVGMVTGRLPSTEVTLDPTDVNFGEARADQLRRLVELGPPSRNPRALQALLGAGGDAHEPLGVRLPDGTVHLVGYGDALAALWHQAYGEPLKVKVADAPPGVETRAEKDDRERAALRQDADAATAQVTEWMRTYLDGGEHLKAIREYQHAQYEEVNERRKALDRARGQWDAERLMRANAGDTKAEAEASRQLEKIDAQKRALSAWRDQLRQESREHLARLLAGEPKHNIEMKAAPGRAAPPGMTMATVHAAKAWLDRVMVRAAGDRPVPPITVSDLPPDEDGRSVIDAAGNMRLAVGVGVDSVIHEVGHMLENHVPGVWHAARQFLRHRVRDEKSVALSTLPGGDDYGPDEFGRKDKFDMLFPHPAQAYYAGKEYQGGQTEIISMGLEMLYADPYDFAQKDPEYFKFVLGILSGSIRGDRKQRPRRAHISAPPAHAAPFSQEGPDPRAMQ